jgi:hypothetical protein
MSWSVVQRRVHHQAELCSLMFTNGFKAVLGAFAPWRETTSRANCMNHESTEARKLFCALVFSWFISPSAHVTHAKALRRKDLSVKPTNRAQRRQPAKATMGKHGSTSVGLLCKGASTFRLNCVHLCLPMVSTQFLMAWRELASASVTAARLRLLRYRRRLTRR